MLVELLCYRLIVKDKSNTSNHILPTKAYLLIVGIKISTNANACPNCDHGNMSSDPLLVVSGRVCPISLSSTEQNGMQMVLLSENKSSIAL